MQFDTSGIMNLDSALEVQAAEFGKIREAVRRLSFQPVDPVGMYAAVAYKAIDGGKLGITFDPFELELVNVADSYGNDLLKFLMPKRREFTPNDFAFMDDLPPVREFLDGLGYSSVSDACQLQMLNSVGRAMELAELAVITTRITLNPNEPVVVMRDGLLRFPFLKREAKGRLLDLLRRHPRQVLVGVAKSSRVLSLTGAAMLVEKTFPPNSTGHVEVPEELERMAYKWVPGSLGFPLGNLHVAKLSARNRLLVTVEVPHDRANDRRVYSRQQVGEIFGHLIKDSAASFPTLGYPQTLMRAHEKAVRTGFAASVWRDKVLGCLLEKVGDPSIVAQLKETWMLREYIKSPYLGGT